MESLKQALVGVTCADDDEVREMAGRLHARTCEIISDPLARGWFKLFKHMDDDGSGRVSFAAFEDLVRHELQLPARELPEARLKAVWVALDDDGSGYISAGEFGAFMRKGKSNEPAPLTWRAKVEAQKRASGDSVRAARRKAKSSSLLQAGP